MINTIPEKAVAKIVISGLFVLCVNKQERYAEIGVYEFADGHNFSIKITKHSYVADTQIGETVEIKSERGGTQMKNISIKIKNRLADLDIYHSPAIKEEDFKADPSKLRGSKSMTNPANHKQDFRWVMDLESKSFHNRKLSITPGTLDRKIRIYNGVMYTNVVEPRSMKLAFPEAIQLVAQPAIPQPIVPSSFFVAKELGINLVADSPDSHVIISYGTDKSERTSKITLSPSEEYYYNIAFDNNCPTPSTVSAATAPLNPSGSDTTEKHFSDFQHYYNVFHGISIGERFDFEVWRGAGGGSKLVPCDFVFLGQHDELE